MPWVRFWVRESCAASGYSNHIVDYDNDHFEHYDVLPTADELRKTADDLFDDFVPWDMFRPVKKSYEVYDELTPFIKLELTKRAEGMVRAGKRSLAEINGPNTSYEGHSWIKVKKYVMDPNKTWEERYKELEAHHAEETTFLIDEVRKLAKNHV